MIEMIFKGVLTTAVVFLSYSIGFAQEAEPPQAPSHPTDMLAMMHMESVNVGDLNLLNELYHKDATLYMLPDKVLAEGKDEIMNYWTEKFKKEEGEEKMMELMENFQGGDRLAVRVRQFKGKNKAVETIVLFEIKDNLIYRVYY